MWLKRCLPVIFLLAVWPSAMFSSATLHTIINGQVVDPGMFPEVIRISSSQGQCTGTVIGPRVLITAAHCVGENQYIERVRRRPPTPFSLPEMENPFGDPDPEEVAARGFEILGNCLAGQMPTRGRCWQHPKYRGGQHDFDFALCLLAVEQEPPYAMISPLPVFIHDFVQLMGYGCTGEDGVGAGTFRHGLVRVSRLPYRDVYFETQGRVALCYGDSGGPAMRVNDSGEHEIVGINSRGDIRTRSLFSAVYLPSVRAWIKDFSKRYGVTVVGLSLERPARFVLPVRSHLDAERMFGS